MFHRSLVIMGYFDLFYHFCLGNVTPLPFQGALCPLINNNELLSDHAGAGVCKR